MMYGNSYGSGFLLMHSFGGLLGIAFLFGLIFFATWAVKTIKKEQLLHWAVLLVAVSVIGWILMASLGGFWGRGSSSGWSNGNRGPGMMWGWDIIESAPN